MNKRAARQLAVLAQCDKHPPRSIPCAVYGCDQPANPANPRTVQTPGMPAPAFYYYCNRHPHGRTFYELQPRDVDGD